MPDEHVLWTHVTSPFINSDVYDQAIEKYFENLDHFDSLMTVTKLQRFIWNDNEPVSYNRDIEKWPRTQTIKPLWEVDGGIFLAHKSIYELNNDRIGYVPYLLQISDEIAFDIDWMTDYKIAEALYLSMHGMPKVSSKSVKRNVEKKRTKKEISQTVL